MDGPGEATTADVTYNILWLCSTNGMNEATEGRIEIHSVANGMRSVGSSKAVGGHHGAEARRKDLMNFTTDEAAETSDITSTTSEESSMLDITCIARLMWGSWEATFYGSYNPPSASYRFNKGALFDFNIRAINECMDIGFKGHTITRLGIDCPQRDDRGYEILVFHMVWEQSTVESRTARLFAKRELGEASLGFSEGEFQELGIPKRRQPDVPAASAKPEDGAHHGENNARKDRRVGRMGFSDGARGISRGGKARGRVRPTKKPSHGLTWHTWGRINK